MKFANILFIGNMVVDAHLLEQKNDHITIDKNAAKSAMHAAAEYAKEHHHDPKQAAS